MNSTPAFMAGILLLNAFHLTAEDSVRSDTAVWIVRREDVSFVDRDGKLSAKSCGLLTKWCDSPAKENAWGGPRLRVSIVSSEDNTRELWSAVLGAWPYSYDFQIVKRDKTSGLAFGSGGSVCLVWPLKLGDTELDLSGRDRVLKDRVNIVKMFGEEAFDGSSHSLRPNLSLKRVWFDTTWRIEVAGDHGAIYGVAKGTDGKWVATKNPPPPMAEELAKQKQAKLNEELLDAAERGELKRVIAAVAAGADINCQNASEIGKGKVPLSAAVQEGRKEVAQWLLEKKVDVNKTDNNQGTPLMYAVDNGYADLSELLLQHGADPNRREIQGRTALMAAAALGEIRIINLLLANNADPSLKDKSGKTALDYAVQESQREAATLLREKIQTK